MTSDILSVSAPANRSTPCAPPPAGRATSSTPGGATSAAAASLPAQGKTLAGLQGPVRIVRDRWGIPHVDADNDRDLFFGFGYATAQDRLFQLDYLRRKARGRWPRSSAPRRSSPTCSIAPSDLAQDRRRRVGKRCRGQRGALLEAYSRGVNALIEDQPRALPIEFDLLDYRAGAVAAGRQPGRSTASSAGI